MSSGVYITSVTTCTYTSNTNILIYNYTSAPLITGYLMYMYIWDEFHIECYSIISLSPLSEISCAVQSELRLVHLIISSASIIIHLHVHKLRWSKKSMYICTCTVHVHVLYMYMYDNTCTCTLFTHNPLLWHVFH